MFGWQILSSGTNKAIILLTIILSSVSHICPFGCTPPQTHQLYLVTNLRQLGFTNSQQTTETQAPCWR